MKWNGAILACCGLITAGAAAYNLVRKSSPGTPVRTVANWRTYIPAGHRIGPADAAVTAVVFSDYECPFSRKLAEQLQMLYRKFPGQFSVVYRNFPLPGHKHARAAAAAAECADRQGKFRAFHEAITKAPVTALAGPWNALAVESGILDTLAFSDCRMSPTIQAKINTDIADGEILGVTATPGFLLNDEQYSGIQNDLEKLVANALKRTGKPLHANAGF